MASDPLRLADWWALTAIQLTIVVLLVWSLLQSTGLVAWVRWKRCGGGSRANVNVLRGAESRARFAAVYGFASVIILQVINVSEAYKGEKVLLILLDLAAISYLCFLNSWFRNKLIGWASRYEKTPD